jgi:tetratricopeptide (TPR) repeat protein
MRHPRNLLPAAALAAAALPLAACASVDRTTPLREFARGEYSSARAWYEGRLSEDKDDEALDRNEAGTVALLQGDIDGAHRHFQEAFNIMESLSSTAGETASAIVGSESSKTWKGDPYERCMNAYYLGVTYWLQGDADNAAASFKAGVLRDADSEQGAAQSDFALLWFLMGMAQREAWHEDRGAAALAKAHALVPKCLWLDPARANDANFLLVLDVGLGPVKVATEAHGSVVKFKRQPYQAAFAEVFADGNALGRTEQASDICQQAVTRGPKVMESINKGKAVFKDAAVIGGAFVLENSGSTSSDVIGWALIALGILLPAEGDVRTWATLPGEVQVLVAHLEPGDHEITVAVREKSGAALPQNSRKLHVNVRENHLTFAWTRAAHSEVVHAGEGTMPGSR